VVLGRGLNYANAFEFALKLMETCYVVAERFQAPNLLHGPIAMLEASFPAFLFAPAGVTWPGTREMIAKLTELQAETLIVTDTKQRGSGSRPPRHRSSGGAGRTLHADPLHCSRAIVRSVAGRGEGAESGSAAGAEQSHQDDVATDELQMHKDKYFVSNPCSSSLICG